jgi:hypothetical protein
MATYKVIQDIEAEDKLVGPLSLRQFIYAGIGGFLGYLTVLAVMKHVPFLAAVFVPPALFCFFFAWPWSPDQPTEVWALARIRFYFKPRKRIWDQSGVKELVTITVPKRIEKTYTNGLSQNEVHSRLSALADTIDSRGWVIKNSNINLSTNTPYINPADSSDRLIGYDSIPQEVPAIDIQASDDIMDAQNNPIAHQFDEMISASEKAHRAEIVDRLREQPQAPAAAAQQQAQNDYWFLHEQAAAGQNPAAAASDVVFANPQVVQPGTNQSVGPVAADPTPDEMALAEHLREEHFDLPHNPYSHLKTIQPVDHNAPYPIPAPPTPAQVQLTAAAPIPVPTQNPVPPSTDAAILNLANNNDLNVATIAREAQKAREPKQSPEDEVVISLR